MLVCKNCKKKIRYRRDLNKWFVYSDEVFPHWELHNCEVGK